MSSTRTKCPACRNGSGRICWYTHTPFWRRRSSSTHALVALADPTPSKSYVIIYSHTVSRAPVQLTSNVHLLYAHTLYIITKQTAIQKSNVCNRVVYEQKTKQNPNTIEMCHTDFSTSVTHYLHVQLTHTKSKLYTTYIFIVEYYKTYKYI